MKLVDTNVFIYAVGRPHEYRDSCRELLRQFESKQHDANIDVELLQEVLFIFWRRRSVVEGGALIDQISAAFADPISVTLGDVRRARETLRDYPFLAPRDAIHAAVVLTRGLEGIISTDQGFDAIPGIRRFDPIDLVEGS